VRAQATAGETAMAPRAVGTPYASASNPNSGAATPPAETARPRVTPLAPSDSYVRMARSTAVTIGRTNSPSDVSGWA